MTDFDPLTQGTQAVYGRGPMDILIEGARTAPRETRLTDRCTWWHCPRAGSILFADTTTFEPIAHLCDKHARAYVKAPAYWRSVANEKLRPLLRPKDMEHLPLPITKLPQRVE